MKKDEMKVSQALEQLINQKPFEELTWEERNSVLLEISEDEYKLLYATSERASATFKKHKQLPDDVIKSSILASFDTRQAKRPGPKIVPLFSYSVPLYQAVAVVVFTVLILTAFRFFNLREDISNPKVIYVEKKDTVFIPLGSAITSQIDSNKEKAGIIHNNVMPVHETVTKYATSKNGLSDGEIKKMELTRCRSIKMDSGLKQFMVSID